VLRKPFEALALVRRHQARHHPFIGDEAGTDSMNGRVTREIKAHHQAQRCLTQGFRGHVRGHEYIAAAIHELDQHLFAIALLKVAVQCPRGPATGTQVARHNLTLLLHIAEHQCGSAMMMLQERFQRFLPSCARDPEKRLGGITSATGSFVMAT